MLVRIFNAVAYWLLISKLNKVLAPKYFPTKKWSILFYAFTFLLWFVPYLSVRFSSENYSGFFFLLGLYFFFKDSSKNKNFLAIGVFFALAVLFRYQIGIAVIGAYLFMLIIDKIKFSKILLSVLSFTPIILLGSYLDYLFYDEFVLAPYNYFKLNILDGRAADFGTSPWWYYLVTALYVTIPPISIILLGSFFVGLKKLKYSIFTWSILPFILIHFIIGHKEFRFLFPMSYEFIFIAIYGLQAYFKDRKSKKYQRRIFRFAIGLNITLLLFMMLKPANEMLPNYKYLYDNIDLGDRNLVSTDKETYYLMAGIKSTFYTPPTINSNTIASKDSLASYLEAQQLDACFFIYDKYDYTDTIEGYDIEKVYCVYPEWIKGIKGFDWQDIISTHSIYLIKKKS
jgi:phosphatidylinositol glycan class B